MVCVCSTYKESLFSEEFSVEIDVLGLDEKIHTMSLSKAGK